jgi:group II intron reverse transcriptase/maturase
MENERKDIKTQVELGHKLYTLIHYVNKETLMSHHEKQQRNKATGVDKVTKEQYGTNLENNIDNLLERMKKFAYKPQAVRRTYIPKLDGKLRPLGIPAYEDKLVQGCMSDILTQIYECKFLDYSYGFRPNKNCHQAIRESNQLIMTKKVNYILDCDIKGFFDNVNHEWLMKFLENDIHDKKFLRYIVKFLKSGIIEGMKFYESEKGTPQGGLISPILANVYLHYVIDLWFKHLKEKEIIKGEVYLIRYADDFVVMFQYEEQAKKFYSMLIERLNKFGLEVAEDKTRIIPFGRYKGTKDTFDFLGFMHYNGTTKTGKYTVGHKISKKKKKMKKQAITKWLKENRHIMISELISKLNKKIIGLYSYYGINGMITELQHLYTHAKRMLYSVVSRRSQRSIKWDVFKIIVEERYPITKPKIYKDIWQWSV